MQAPRVGSVLCCLWAPESGVLASVFSIYQVWPLGKPLSCCSLKGGSLTVRSASHADHWRCVLPPILPRDASTVGSDRTHETCTVSGDLEG